jgi:hypothetical protein
MLFAIGSFPLVGNLGGGVYNAGALDMKDCRVVDCDAANGGGIWNSGSSQLMRCRIESCSNNDANFAANGCGILSYGDIALQSCIVSNCAGGPDAFGGGILSLSSLAATNCTFVGNDAVEGGGLWLSGSNILLGCTVNDNSVMGGGAGVRSLGILRMLNCTVSHNNFGGGPDADGALNSGTLILTSCTFASNSCGGGTVYSQNSMFAGSGSNDFSGVLISQGFNLIQNTNGCTIVGDGTGNIYGLDPRLGPLQDNGGPTWTHALLPGSPAIDQGTAAGLTQDQRGRRRPVDFPRLPNAGDGSDIGAYELAHGAVRLHSLSLAPGGGKRWTLEGEAGDICVIEASSDMVHWTPVSTNTIPNVGSLTVTDPDLERHLSRFYRAVTQGDAATGAN